MPVLPTVQVQCNSQCPTSKVKQTQSLMMRDPWLGDRSFARSNGEKSCKGTLMVGLCQVTVHKLCVTVKFFKFFLCVTVKFFILKGTNKVLFPRYRSKWPGRFVLDEYQTYSLVLTWAHLSSRRPLQPPYRDAVLQPRSDRRRKPPRIPKQQTHRHYR